MRLSIYELTAVLVLVLEVVLVAEKAFNGRTPQDPKIKNEDNPPAYLFPQKRRTNNFKEYY